MNGYLQIDLNDQMVGIKYGYPAIREFSLLIEKSKETYYEGDQLSLLGIAKIIHLGYKNNCIVKEVEPTLTFETFVDWVESSLNDDKIKTEIAKALNTFAESQYVKSLIETGKEVEEDTKKKTLKPGSKKSKEPSLQPE